MENFVECDIYEEKSILRISLGGYYCQSQLRIYLKSSSFSDCLYLMFLACFISEHDFIVFLQKSNLLYPGRILLGDMLEKFIVFEILLPSGLIERESENKN